MEVEAHKRGNFESHDLHVKSSELLQEERQALSFLDSSLWSASQKRIWAKEEMGDEKGKCWADLENYPGNVLNESNPWLWMQRLQVDGPFG